MTISNKSEYLRYRFNRSLESLDDARIMIENKRWNTSVNRLYYSCFYAVIALLLKNDIETQSITVPEPDSGMNLLKKV